MSQVEVGFLWVDRTTRQREELNMDHVRSLADSFQRITQLTPVLYKPSGEIIAGEHRWEAAKLLGWTHLKAELDESDDDDLHQAMELEENVKRIDMTWQEKAKAILKYHRQRTKAEPGWNQGKTAEALGIDEGTVSASIQAAQEIENGNEKIASAPKLSTAHNTLARAASRAAESEVVRALSAERNQPKPAQPNPDNKSDGGSSQGIVAPASSAIVPVEEPNRILNTNFLEWAPTYTGPKFNFLHADFPYGVNIDKSDQAGGDQRGAYKDTPETYWTLLECLADNWDRLMLPSAHIMFWFSMDFYTETQEFFAARIPQLEMDVFPLYWLKSDGKGILPDPARGPRRIVETCLFGRSGDRKVVQAVANGYACPTNKNEAIHLSEKPEPMLRHFFKMLVDENTAMLDPTCGGGSALRAADSLGAAYIQGLELNPEYAEAANVAFKRARLLRKVTL